MIDKVEELGKENSEIILVAFGVLAIAIGGFVTQMGTMASGDATDTHQQSRQLGSAGGQTELSYDSSKAVEVERKRIETFDIDYEAPNVQNAVDVSKRIAEKFGGYTESENFHNSETGGDSASVTLRVPQENVSEFLDELDANNWKLESRNRNVDDVTERYTELKLELKNKRQELQRLEELINRTNETESLVKIQERMGELRSRIQFIESQMQDIDRRVDYTRIDLRFEEPEPLTAEFELRESFRNAYQGIFTSLNWMIVGIGYLLPFGLLYAAYRLIGRRTGE